MSILSDISGRGNIHGKCVTRGFTTYIGLPTITQDKNNVLIQFFTLSNLYIDSINLFGEQNTALDISFDMEIEGGLKSFKLKLDRKYEVRIFEQTIVKIYMNNLPYVTGLLKIRPTQDNADQYLTYEGIGLIELLDNEQINEVYENVTVKYILDDLILNQMINTDIYFDTSKIIPPDITIIKLEFNNVSILEAIKTLLNLCNTDFNNDEYKFYVDIDRFFCFDTIDKDIIIDTWTEGFDYQNPSIQENEGKIINEIKIFRTQEDSQEVEIVTTLSDSLSIAKYGIKSKSITVNNYADIADATLIGNYNIERYKYPYKTAKLKNMTIEAPLEFGTYRINDGIQEITKSISDFNDLSEFDMGKIINTVITIEDYIVQSGRLCYKIETHAGSSGEYIEITLPQQINFPEYIDLWIRQEIPGQFIFFMFFDEYGNTVEYDEINMITENGYDIITENGNDLIMESGSTGINVYLSGQFIPVTIPIDNTQIKSLKKVRIIFTTNAENTFYLDRLECRSRQYITSDLVLRKASYKINGGIFTSDISLGEPVKNAVDDLTELGDETANIQAIFQKS
jgi:hypothetical protein